MEIIGAATLLTDVTGSLAYHLSLAMALAVIYSLALVFRRRHPGEVVSRWINASSILLALRLLHLALTALVWTDWLAVDNLLPLLDRYSIFMGLLTFIWACRLPRPRSSRSFFLTGLGIGLFAAVISQVLAQLAPTTEPFNHTLMDAGWSILTLVICLIATMALFSNRMAGWNLIVAPFALLLTGNVLHITLGPTTGSLAGFVRIAEIAAYPLFAIVAARDLAEDSEQTRHQSMGLATIAPSSEMGFILQTVSSLAALSTSPYQADFAERAVEEIARRLNSRFALLFGIPDHQQRINLATGIDLGKGAAIPPTLLEGRFCPTLSNLLGSKRTRILRANQLTPDMQYIHEATAHPVAGPGLFAPLINQEEFLGGLLLVAPLNRQRWTGKDREALDVVSTFLARRFLELGIRLEADQIHSFPGHGEKTMQERLQALEKENESLRHSLDVLQTGEGVIQREDFDSIVVLHERDRELIDQLEAEVKRLQFLAAQEREAGEEGTEDFESFILAQQRDRETIEQLKAENERLQSLLAQAGDRTEDPSEIDRMKSELQLALREMAELRNQLENAYAAAEPQLAVEAERPTEEETSQGLPFPEPMENQAILSLAHALRHPTASILAYTDLLLGESVGLLGAMQRQFLERMRSATERIGDLLNDLVQTSTMEPGLISLMPGPIEIMHCMEQAVSQVGSAMISKDITLQLDFPEDLPPILAEEDALVQILFHLLDNAVAACMEGGVVRLKADIQSMENTRFVLLAVTDAGEGIHPGDLPKVFQRIYRADKGLIPGIGDTGFGLITVKTLVEMLRGRVWVESERGTGTTYTVLLPAADQAESAHQPGNE